MEKYEKSLSQLQKIGNEILAKYNKDNPYYEVDIEYIIESGFGIHIEPVPLKVQHLVEAFPSIAKNIIYIDIGLMDDLRQERRYRFTLAEELAGILLMSRYSFINRAIEIRDELCGAVGRKRKPR